MLPHSRIGWMSHTRRLVARMQEITTENNCKDVLGDFQQTFPGSGQGTGILILVLSLIFILPGSPTAVE